MHPSSKHLTLQSIESADVIKLGKKPQESTMTDHTLHLKEPLMRKAPSPCIPTQSVIQPKEPQSSRKPPFNSGTSPSPKPKEKTQPQLTLVKPLPQLKQKKICINTANTEYPLIDQVCKEELGWRISKEPDPLKDNFDIWWNDLGCAADFLATLKPF